MTKLLTLILLALTLPLRADDWPQWRGPERTAHVPAGVAVPQTLGPVTPAWTAKLGNGLSSPVVAGGKVFCPDDAGGKETLHAYDATTGQPLWSVPVDALHKDSQSPAGPRCTPVADGDRVYHQSCRGELQCLAASDGHVLWRTNYVKDFGAVFIGEKGSAAGATRHGYDGSPIVDGDHLIVEVGGKPDAAFVCFDKVTGKVIWKSGTETPAYAAPILATVAGRRQLVAFVVEGVVGVDPSTGKALWRVPVKTALGRHVTTPVVVSGDTVVVASHQAGLIAVKVTADGEAFSAVPAWTAKDAAINFSSPVVVGNHLYGVGPRKNVICVDRATGHQAWSNDTLLTGDAGRAHAALLVLPDDRILMLTDGGRLVLFAADPAAYKEIARTQACGTNWCTPAYANGRLYLRDQNQLVCLKLVE